MNKFGATPEEAEKNIEALRKKTFLEWFKGLFKK
jgi:hypothetical protein